jgi:hypothetical protein
MRCDECFDAMRWKNDLDPTCRNHEEWHASISCLDEHLATPDRRPLTMHGEEFDLSRCQNRKYTLDR